MVAWCLEDIGWVLLAARNFDHVIVYSKCNGVPPPQLTVEKKITIETLPNIGVCDQTYLHHIVTNWDSLAFWTVFYKGFLLFHCLPFEMIRTEVESFPSFLCCYGHTADENDPNGFSPSFELFHYSPRHHEAMTGFVLANQTLGQWVASTFGYANALRMFSFSFSFCYGGYFAVPLHTIRRQPISVYEAMKKQQVHIIEEVDHFIERSWRVLFLGPILGCTANDTDIWVDPGNMTKLDIK